MSSLTITGVTKSFGAGASATRAVDDVTLGERTAEVAAWGEQCGWGGVAAHRGQRRSV